MLILYILEFFLGFSANSVSFGIKYTASVYDVGFP